MFSPQGVGNESINGCSSNIICFVCLFAFLRTYLREGGGEHEPGEGDAGSPLSRKPDLGKKIPRLWDHDLS